MNNIAKGCGRAHVKLMDSDGIPREAVLEDALYVPSIKQNIFSVQCATKRGSAVQFKQGAELRSKNGTMVNISKKG